MNSVNDMKKILLSGAATALAPMNKGKSHFPMAFFSWKLSLITLGGWGEDFFELNEGCIYSIKKDDWDLLPSYPFPIWSNSICIVNNDWLYNFAGQGSKWEVGRLELAASTYRPNY